jgi:hypothetical protein
MGIYKIPKNHHCKRFSKYLKMVEIHNTGDLEVYFSVGKHCHVYE